ncbi:MAG TPA: MATE family efflux transporter [Thermoanaerobaculia bacterium]|jgi:MATE family multidrug resistance protein|nr:MATE family efflux transporter [Thermoanaerobaculia bacterium]
MTTPATSIPLASSPRTFRDEMAAAVRLATPVVFVQLGSMLMGVVDTIMLGHLSAEALAAGALGHSTNITLLMFGLGTLAALDPLISQAYGAREPEAVAAHLQRGMLLALALSLPMGLLLWDIAPLLRAVGQPEAVIGDAAAYARGIIWGVPAYFLFMAVRQTLQAMSVVRPAGWAIVVGNILNALLDWVLIFGHLGFPALGVAGSSYATSTARWLMLAWLVFASRRQLAPYWRGFTAEAARLSSYLRLLRIGVPIGLHQSIEILLFASAGLLMGRMGVAQLAGHQITLNLASLSFMVPLGISGAATTRVGNAIGRQDMTGARRAALACLILGGAVMVLFALLFGVFPETLARIYTQDPATIAMAMILLPVAAMFQVFDGLQVVSVGVLRGAADTAVPAVLAFLGFWAVGLPSGWFLGFRMHFGAPGIWWGLTLGLAAVAALLLLRIVARFRGHIARALG